jgi:uncharacterized protein
MSLSSSSVPVFEIALTALSGVLDKAEAFAKARSMDPAMLLQARLFPDMFPLVRQVQSVSDIAKNGVSRLAGVEPPRFEDNETTIDQLKDRLAKTRDYLKSIDLSKIDDSGGREITFPLGPTHRGRMNGADYLNHFLLPNFYFHLTTAYAILRHCGVEIGKQDYLGPIPIAISTT